MKTYTLEEISEMYLYYFNSSRTLDHMAEYYGISIEVAEGIIALGRELHR